MFLILVGSVFLLAISVHAHRLDTVGLGPSEVYKRLMSPNDQRPDPEMMARFSQTFKPDPMRYFAPRKTRASEVCQADVQSIFMGMMQQQPYSLRYLDAWGQKPAGMLSGNNMWLGDYDQCITIKPVRRADNTTFTPRFWMVGLGYNEQSQKLTTPKPTVFQIYPIVMMAVCIPNSCEIDDLIELLDGQVPPPFQVVPEYIRMADTNPKLDEYAIVAIACFTVVAFFLTLGFLVDVYQRLCIIFCPMKAAEASDASKKKLEEDKPVTCLSHFTGLLLCCSPLTNFEKLFKPPTPPPKGSTWDLSPLNGVRALSLLWVILGHVYVFLMAIFDNNLTFLTFFSRNTYQFVLSGIFAVDSFFFLSGFLAYFSLSKTFSNEKFNFWKFLTHLPYIYIRRYLRLTPAFAAVMLISLGLWRYLWQGPIYFQDTDYNCVTNWWTNLVYVNNFVDSEHTCINWSWYLSNDMQYFILAPFVVYAFVKAPIIGWFLCSLGFVVHIVTSVTLTAVDNLPSTQFPPKGGFDAIFNPSNSTDTPNYRDYFTEYYIKPYTRVGPYIVGLIVCHLVVHHEKWLQRKVFSRWWLQLIIWIITLFTLLEIVYGKQPFYSSEYVPSKAEHAAYNGLARIAWGIALGWVVLSAIFRKAGLIGDVIRWPVWAIPARLSYSAYLLHPLVILFYVQTARRTFHVSDVTIPFMFVATVINTFICSVILTLGFESPVVAVFH